MIARWQFWHVGGDIKIRHTAHPNTERAVCNCNDDVTAEILVSLLNVSARNQPETCQELVDAITSRLLKENESSNKA